MFTHWPHKSSCWSLICFLIWDFMLFRVDNTKNKIAQLYSVLFTEIIVITKMKHNFSGFSVSYWGFCCDWAGHNSLVITSDQIFTTSWTTHLNTKLVCSWLLHLWCQIYGTQGTGKLSSKDWSIATKDSLLWSRDIFVVGILIGAKNWKK